MSAHPHFIFPLLLTQHHHHLICPASLLLLYLLRTLHLHQHRHRILSAQPHFISSPSPHTLSPFASLSVLSYFIHPASLHLLFLILTLCISIFISISSLIYSSHYHLLPSTHLLSSLLHVSHQHQHLSFFFCHISISSIIILTIIHYLLGLTASFVALIYLIITPESHLLSLYSLPIFSIIITYSITVFILSHFHTRISSLTFLYLLHSSSSPSASLPASLSSLSLIFKLESLSLPFLISSHLHHHYVHHPYHHSISFSHQNLTHSPLSPSLFIFNKHHHFQHKHLHFISFSHQNLTHSPASLIYHSASHIPIFTLFPSSLYQQ